MRQLQLSTGCLFPFRLDIVIIPYQPSLVYRIVSVNNLNSSPLLCNTLPTYIPPPFLCPSCTFLPTSSCQLTECLQSFLSSPLDISKHYLTPAVRSFFYCTFLFDIFQTTTNSHPTSFSVPVLLPLARQVVFLAWTRPTWRVWHALVTTMPPLLAQIPPKRSSHTTAPQQQSFLHSPQIRSLMISSSLIRAS